MNLQDRQLLDALNRRQLNLETAVAELKALTVVCLGLSFLYYKFADRWKEWL